MADIAHWVPNGSGTALCGEIEADPLGWDDPTDGDETCVVCEDLLNPQPLIDFAVARYDPLTHRYVPVNFT